MTSFMRKQLEAKRLMQFMMEGKVDEEGTFLIEGEEKTFKRVK
jgi:hypothetical protein